MDKGYAWRSEIIEGNNKKIHMHYDIWRRLEGRPHIKLDHIDRNPLNNQLSNLRPATHAQNGMNKGLRTDSTTGYKGVSWDQSRKKYAADIKVNGKRLRLGRFNTAFEAAKAYDTAALKHCGEFATTNQSLGLLTLLPFDCDS